VRTSRSPRGKGASGGYDGVPKGKNTSTQSSINSLGKKGRKGRERNMLQGAFELIKSRSSRREFEKGSR